jgi:hypothetical protein
MGKIDLCKQINLFKPRLRPYFNPFTRLRDYINLCYWDGSEDNNSNGGKIMLANYLTGKNLAIGTALVLTGLVSGYALKSYKSYREEPKVVKPEKVNVFRVSEEYEGVMVESNGYFISISEDGNLVGLNINEEKTPFNFTETRRKDRSLSEGKLEKFLEVSGKPIKIGPESVTPTSVRIKKRD